MPYYSDEIVVPDKAFHELIWEQLQKHGDKTAIIDASHDGDERSITHLQLLDQSKKCAAFLQSLGVRKGDYISLCVSGSIEFTCLMIGIMGSGGVVAPCNPSYRKSEILQQFNISRPCFVFVDEKGVGAVRAVKEEVSFIQEIFVVGKSSKYTTLNQIIAKTDPEPLTKIDIDPINDIAFAPHSSGTTGLPKCALKSHRSFVAMWAMEGVCSKSSPPPSYYSNRPMYHLGGFGFLINFILNGVKVVTQRQNQIDTMFKAIEKYRITALECVAPMLVEMANTVSYEDYDLSSLKVIRFGAAPSSRDVIQRTRKKSGVTLVSLYGLTEGGLVSGGVVAEDSLSSFTGKICKGVQVKITDPHTGEECSVGYDGEIRIRSAQVTNGYLKNPTANAEAFDNDGWFRTGDIGHLDKAGNLYVIDRMKQIIKVKGVQVSPSELEGVIISHPKVSDVGVVGIPDDTNGELPKAFVVSNDPTLTAEDIHTIVNDNLVDYKHLGGGVEFIATIPKSETGKIQRNELKKMAGF